MNWILTWQDLVAWTIVGVVLFLTWRRRTSQSSRACGSCGETEEVGPGSRVSLSKTRLITRLKE